LRWYGHVPRKEDNNWVKKCREYEVEGSKEDLERGCAKRNCQAHKLNREDAVDRSRWTKLMISIGASG